MVLAGKVTVWRETAAYSLAAWPAPLEVLAAIVTAVSTGLLSDTLKVIVVVPLLPSTIDGLSIVSVALSSLVIVPVAVDLWVMAAACVAVVPADRPQSDRERLVGLDHRVALDRHRQSASPPPCRRSAAWS